MDAQTRHALKQNELGELLQNLRGSVGTPEFRRWALLIILVVLAVVSYRVWRWNTVTADQVAWSQLLNPARSDNEADLLAHLREQAGKHARGNVGAAARLMLADALTTEAYRDTTKSEPLLSEAAEALRAVVGDNSAAAAYHGAALFKLAATSESLGKFDEARKSYEALTKEERYAGSPYRSAAQTRLNSLDAIAQPITFAPGSQPAAPEPAPMSEAPSVSTPIAAPTPAAPTPAAPTDAAPTDAPPPTPADQPAASPTSSDTPPANADEQPVQPSTP